MAYQTTNPYTGEILKTFPTPPMQKWPRPWNAAMPPSNNGA